MWFMVVLSWIAILVQMVFIILSIATGLYYLAELVEEYTKVAAQAIRYMIFFCLAIYILLLLFEDLPFSMITCGILSHIIHLLILQNFPYFEFTSIPFILGCLFVIVNHYLAFTYFASKFVPFSQVLGYFTICLWIVPFTFFISLSANDNVLPVTIGGDHQEGRPLLNDIDGDVVSSIFSRKNKKLSLLSFFNYAKESLLPQRVKKSF